MSGRDLGKSSEMTITKVEVRTLSEKGVPKITRRNSTLTCQKGVTEWTLCFTKKQREERKSWEGSGHMAPTTTTTMAPKSSDSEPSLSHALVITQHALGPQNEALGCQDGEGSRPCPQEDLEG